MGLRMYLLLVLALLLFTHQSQGVLERQGHSLSVSRFTTDSAAGQPLPNPNPINDRKNFKRRCDCKGKTASKCLQQSNRQNSKYKFKLCQKKNRNSKYGPSVPI